MGDKVVRAGRMAEVVAKANPKVVQVLEELLAEAKAGQVQSLVAVYDCAERGESSHAMVLDGATGLLFYEMDLVRHRVIGAIGDKMNSEQGLL